MPPKLCPLWVNSGHSISANSVVLNGRFQVLSGRSNREETL
jgi:hypothetical protein